jgi:hypothetical protein
MAAQPLSIRACLTPLCVHSFNRQRAAAAVVHPDVPNALFSGTVNFNERAACNRA